MWGHRIPTAIFFIKWFLAVESETDNCSLQAYWTNYNHVKTLFLFDEHCLKTTMQNYATLSKALQPYSLSKPYM